MPEERLIADYGRDGHDIYCEVTDPAWRGFRPCDCKSRHEWVRQAMDLFEETPERTDGGDT